MLYWVLTKGMYTEVLENYTCFFFRILNTTMSANYKRLEK